MISNIAHLEAQRIKHSLCCCVYWIHEWTRSLLFEFLIANVTCWYVYSQNSSHWNYSFSYDNIDVGMMTVKEALWRSGRALISGAERFETAFARNFKSCLCSPNRAWVCPVPLRVGKADGGEEEEWHSTFTFYKCNRANNRSYLKSP